MSFLALAKVDIEIDYDGKKYKLGALSFKEMAEYVLWYQYKELDEAKIVTKDLPQTLRDKILEETFEKCRTRKYKYFDNGVEKEGPLSWEIPEVQDSMSTVAGIAQQLFLSLRINHPEITKQDVSKIISLRNYREILARLYEINGLIYAEEGNNQSGEANPNLKNSSL